MRAARWAPRAHPLDRRRLVVEGLARPCELAQVNQALRLVVRGHRKEVRLAVALQTLERGIEVRECLAVAARHAAVQADVGADHGTLGPVDVAQFGLQRQGPLGQRQGLVEVAEVALDGGEVAGLHRQLGQVAERLRDGDRLLEREGGLAQAPQRIQDVVGPANFSFA